LAPLVNFVHSVMPDREHCDTKGAIVTIDDVLSARECQDLIARIATGDWHPTASINADEPLITSGADASDAGRDQDALARIDDAMLALRLYHRVAEHLPAALEERQLLGLKPNMHFLRYATGHSSALHRDQPYPGRGEERSELTLLIYLNDGFGGGQTEFPDQRHIVAPRVGRAVLFPHQAAHRGATVTDGTKYVLRTEIYYSPVRGHAREG
jgi:predicted 2-oxoglutarate/Fe(II)-dependent dioxygenase YbiX